MTQQPLSPQPSLSPQRPLDGLRVLDLSRALSGPFAGRILADLGADVVKVELPGAGMPYRFSNAGSGPVRGVPETGEHTQDVLAEWAGRAD
jgi:crotonobetainyl-CoA:carnitine CoA-transferase CaiB-like acyl-CoA transferase